MAIKIRQFNTITGVTATLKSGGSLLPNTTYYVRIIVTDITGTLNTMRTLNAKNDASVEISFTTTTTELSADISWDVVTGVNVGTTHCYVVCVSDTSGVYQNKKTNKLANSGVDTATTYALTTYDGLNTLSYTSFGFPFLIKEGRSLANLDVAFGLSFDDGLVTVSWDGLVGLDDIYAQAVTDGVERYFFNDPYNFAIVGGFSWKDGDAGAGAQLNDAGDTYTYVKKAITFLVSTGMKCLDSNVELAFGRANADGFAYTSGNIISFLPIISTYQYILVDLRHGTFNFYGNFLRSIGEQYLFTTSTLATINWNNTLISGRLQTNSSLIFDKNIINMGVTQLYGSAFYDCKLSVSGSVFATGGNMYRTTVYEAYSYFLNPYASAKVYLYDMYFALSDGLLPQKIRWQLNVDARIYSYVSVKFRTTAGAKIVIKDNSGNNAEIYEYGTDVYNKVGAEIITGYVTADINGEATIYLLVYESKWNDVTGDQYDTIWGYKGDFDVTITADGKQTFNYTIKEDLIEPQYKIEYPLHDQVSMIITDKGEFRNTDPTNGDNILFLE